MMDKKKLILIAILIFFLSIILYYTSGSGPVPIENNEIIINKNSDSDAYEIDISNGDFEIEKYELNLSIPDYSDRDLIKLVSEFEAEIKKTILNGNDSFSIITKDLLFVSRLEGYPFEIAYEAEDEELINNEGIITCEDSFDSEIILHLSYGSFYESISIPIHVEPDSETRKRIIAEKLKNNILSAIYEENAMIETEDSYLIKLPEDVDGKNITYQYSGSERNVVYLLIGPIALILLYMGFQKDKRDLKKERDRKIQDEYPVMIQKMSLYLTSGLTIRNIWIQLYEEAEKKDKCKNPLYEEMRISVNELKSGVSESTVYKNFGKRINIPEIVRFTALLSQNLKKGSNSLAVQLMEESEKAFEEKKQRALRMGEEAGTKLLGPMMLILLDILVMIILPAFWSI